MGAQKKFISKLAANGQVVVPKELRDWLSLKGGDSIIFLAEESETGFLRIMIQRPSPSFSNIFGIFSDLNGKPLKELLKSIDVEEMK